MSAIEQANKQQLDASKPEVSTFVAASAGSGKTKLLTDRLLRLMVTGSAPEKILCLTYTKAAAAEMRIRLNRRLGEWVTMPQAELEEKLAGLEIDINASTLRRARELFADVLDLPGGMRIETIHAFCQSLLRRFPLEAQLSPHFSVADDELAGQRLRTARESILASPAMRQMIQTLVAEIDEQRFAAINKQFIQAVEPGLLQWQPKALADRLLGLLGVDEVDEEALYASMVSPPRELILRDYLRQVLESGTPTGKIWAQTGLAWLELSHEQRCDKKSLWMSTLFTKAGEILKLSRHFGKNIQNADIIREAFIKEAQRIATLEEQLNAIRLVRINQALLEILIPIGRADHEAKNLAAELSYADLISQTSRLLIDPGAAWVLYKLDGGIEHLLLDEVQDTAPEQWLIANAIAAEFFSGLGAQGKPRSIFAVGDPKQSIFSFQGADLKSFEKYKNKFKSLAEAVNRQWSDGELSVSFRSTAPVLQLTDAVFAQGFARRGVLGFDEVLRHGISRQGQAGEAIIWPLMEATEPTETPDWETPDDYHGAQSAIAALAQKVAEYIDARLKQELPAKNRLAKPGDFLILVRSRGPVVGAITSELKARQIEVAGLDRMVLPDQPVVSDLLALCDALLLPEDDLALAQFLVSPLGGLSDESLMHLAMNREGSLMAALHRRAQEREEWRNAKAFYDHLWKKVDFETPFDLLSEALGALGGRAKLLMRFGVEAAEPLDELLSEALNHNAQEPASLQNFVQTLRLSEQAIKRETEAGGDEVRIMTVHGAKGLQAPIVILPDTVSLPKQETGLLWLDDEEAGIKIPFFCPRVELRTQALQERQEEARQTQIEEYNRLLYVALTRAEDEILVCGAKGRREIPENCWYEAVKSGFARLGAQEDENGSLAYRCSQTASPDGVSKISHTKTEELPGWAGAAPDWQAIAPVKDHVRPERIAPSRAGDEKSRSGMPVSPLAGPRAPETKRAIAMARGTAIHALLQYLPDTPAGTWEQTALAYLQGQPHLAVESPKICASVLKILHDKNLSALFGAGSAAETPLAGIVAGREVSGEADRLYIGAEEIIVADYKTDKNPPADIAQIPEKYIFQLAAYRAVLRQIYPNLPVRCLLIWTETVLAMTVPDIMLDKAGLG